MRYARLVMAGATVVALLAAAAATTAHSGGTLQGGQPFVATLTGAAEVPAAGDPNGSGKALLTISPTLGQVCFTIKVEDIALPATGAHIHSGAAGVSGGVVVDLAAPGMSGTATGCRTADAALLNSIVAAPAQYYVNIHTSEFAGGALRGQLAVAPQKPAVAKPPVFAGRAFRANLTGPAEVPTTGDPDGSGKAIVWVNHGQSRICAWIKIRNTDTATAAHIHAGAKDAAGAVVVTLPTPNADGVARGCVKVDKALAKQILSNPRDYYVNVHNAAYPNGALRGQLGKR